MLVYTLATCLSGIAYALAQNGQDTVLGQLPAIMGGNIPAIQNPNKPINSAEAMASVGTGKYHAHFYSNAGLPNHTIYAPKEITSGMKTPILLWGNGGCVAVGTIMAPFLLQIASQGITVFANGAAQSKDLSYNQMRNYSQSNPSWMKFAANWAENQQTSSKEWAHLDLSKVATGGQSCGGMEAAIMSADKRIKTIGIFNSGAFDKNSMPPMPKNVPKSSGGFAGALLNMGNIPDGSKFQVPTFYFLGGETDIATPNGKRDFSKMAPGVPAWLGEWAPGGHGGTYNEVNGGTYGTVASNWLKWVFFGDKEAAEFFKADKPVAQGWSKIQKKDLNKIPSL